MQIYDVRPGARTTLYNRVFTSLSNDYKAKCPRRLRVRIPFTIPFILWSFQYIRDHYPIPLQGALMAALAVGHAFSLRPGEFLATKAKYDTNRFLGANTTFAWFDGCPYSACQAHRWPTGVPSHISSLLDVRKNSQDQGSPVAVAANPSQEPGVFCCVRVITSYIRRAALTDGDPLLVHEACHLGDKTLLHVMKQCAVAMRIDPTRVSIGCLRKNVLTQMKLSTPDLLRRLQGGWRSSVGETHYWAHLLQVANENEHAVHNQGCASVEVIRTMFTTQAVGQKPAALPDTLFSFEGSEDEPLTAVAPPHSPSWGPKKRPATHALQRAARRVGEVHAPPLSSSPGGPVVHHPPAAIPYSIPRVRRSPGVTSALVTAGAAPPRVRTGLLSPTFDSTVRVPGPVRGSHPSVLVSSSHPYIPHSALRASSATPTRSSAFPSWAQPARGAAL
jgi:hypothetical protein